MEKIDLTKLSTETDSYGFYTYSSVHILTDNGTGVATLSGTPSTTDFGETEVVLQVSDGFVTETQRFTIVVDLHNSEGSTYQGYLPLIIK